MKKLLLSVIFCAALLPNLRATIKDEWQKDAQLAIYSTLTGVLKRKSYLHKIKDSRYDSKIKASYVRLISLQEQIASATTKTSAVSSLEDSLSFEIKKLDSLLRDKSYYNCNTFLAL